MSIQDSYNQWSATYDSNENTTRDLDQSVFERTFGKSRFNSILEVGCGTGKNTEFLSRIGARVHALDFSEGMLAKAREKIRVPHVTFSAADIKKRWPFESGSTDLVACNLVLEHVEKLDLVFSEAARVLIKGGFFFVSELHPFRQYAGGAANFSSGEQTTRIPAFVHDVSDFFHAAQAVGLKLKELQEWRHEKDEGKLPRLVTFLFER